MNVSQIYEKFLIPFNLQEHMLRVAALLQIMGESWQGKPTNTDNLTLVGACHDMANIIKFKFDQRLFDITPTQLAEQKRIQTKVVNKYGRDIHRATLAMCTEAGLSLKVIELIDKLEWENIEKFNDLNDWESALPIYADMRIGPKGILPLITRIGDLQKRNPENDYTLIIEAAKKLEVSLQENISIELNSITDSELNERFDRILRLEV